MFNIFEGGADARARKTQERLEILKRAREDGFFDEERIEPIPEIVADGHGPDDTVRVQDAFVKHEDAVEQPHPNDPRGTALLPTASPRPYQPMQWCHNCDEMTRHVTYEQGTPTWHCATCCTCDWCIQALKNQLAASGMGSMTQEDMQSRIDYWGQVRKASEALHDAVTTPTDQLFFCTKCGAGLRCGVCNNTGTGRYCDLCGKKDTGEGFCTNCWKEEDTNG